MNDSSHTHLQATFLPPQPELRRDQGIGCAWCPAWQDIAAGTRRLLALERQNHDLVARLEQTHARMERLERRLAAALAAFARQQPGMASDEHANHQRIAHDFTVLVEHRLYALARAAVGTSTLHVPSHAGAAPDLWFLGVVTSALFQQRPHPDSLRGALQLDRAGTYTLASRIEYAYTRALELWDQASATGLDFAWNFTVAAGELLDTSRQEPWPSRPADLPAQFLVSPAYLVENRVYVRQRLYTGASFGDT